MPQIAWSEVNWWAGLVAALATFFLGAVWYSALFGKAWVKAHHYTEEQVRAMQARRPMPVFLSFMLVAYLALGLVLAVLVQHFDISGAVAGGGFGLVLWMGIAAPIRLTAHIASDEDPAAMFIDGAFQLVFLVMSGAIVGAWR